jgi:hypothetical protein
VTASYKPVGGWLDIGDREKKVVDTGDEEDEREETNFLRDSDAG